MCQDIFHGGDRLKKVRLVFRLEFSLYTVDAYVEAKLRPHV